MSTEEQAEIISVPEKLGQSKSKFIRFRYTWVIENFFFNSKYESPIFSPGDYGNLKWFLTLQASLSGKLDLYICLMPCNISEMTIKYTVSIINANGKTVISSLSPGIHQAVSTTEITEYKVMRDFTTYDMIDGIGEASPTRNLTISCEIEHVNELEIRPDITMIEVPACQLLDNIRHLFENHKLSDVTINVCGQEFPAHKAILSVRSPVFSEKFEDKTAGDPEDETDVEPEVFREMLRYIYTDEVPNLETMADKLLIAAEKYKIERLKLMCEEALRAKLTIENAVDTLILADLQQADQLRTLTIEFITLNTTEVMGTSSYKAMVNSHPYLKMMTGVIRALVTRKNAGAD